MVNKKFMILVIFLVSLLAISAVSAADNATDDVASADEVTDEVISIEENGEILEENNNAEGTFTDLSYEIYKADGQLSLTKNYTYNQRIDNNFKQGIRISKNIVINGNGYTINGNNQARAFNIDESNIVLVDITFVNCHYQQGGAIYWYGDYGILSNCRFINSSSDFGGAVYWIGYKGTLSDCSFEKSSGRGAVNWPGENGILSNCTFVNSNTQYHAGAIDWTGDNGILGNCSFVNSSGETGGAIYWSGDNGILSNCSFVNSSTTLYTNARGGGVYWAGDNGVLSNCNFTNSFARRYGSAIYWISVNGTLLNCSFVNSTGSDCGGSVYWAGDNGSLGNCIFEKSSAYKNGGAIYWTTKNGILSGCDFIDCSAYQEGGAIYIGASSCKVIESSFINCHANLGGGILFGDSKCRLINSNFEGCTAETGSNWYSAYKVIVIIETKTSTVISASDVVTTYGVSKKLTITLTDVNKNVLAEETISINLNNVKYVLKTNSIGKVSFVIPIDLAPKTYVATINYDGNDKYESSTAIANVVVNKADTTLTANDITTTYNSGEKLIAVLKDAYGKAISGAKVTIKLGSNTKTLTTDAKGQISLSTDGLAPNIYTATITFDGNDIYKKSSTSATVTIKQQQKQTKIFLRNALYFVTQTKMVQVTLWDGNNQPLAGKTVYIRAYDSVWRGVTDENGDAYIRVGIGFGTHDATVSFDGDDQYFGSEKAGYIRVIKQTPSVMVRGADTMFKATNPVKIVKVHLRDRYDQPLPEGSKIVLKLNGKTYIGFTDAEGVASIAISINTVGTFTAQAMYGGNTAYNPVTRDVKIRIV